MGLYVSFIRGQILKNRMIESNKGVGRLEVFRAQLSQESPVFK